MATTDHSVSWQQLTTYCHGNCQWHFVPYDHNRYTHHTLVYTHILSVIMKSAFDSHSEPALLGFKSIHLTVLHGMQEKPCLHLHGVVLANDSFTCFVLQLITKSFCLSISTLILYLNEGGVVTSVLAFLAEGIVNNGAVAVLELAFKPGQQALKHSPTTRHSFAVLKLCHPVLPDD